MAGGYPIVLDLSDRLIVIVGGGAVGVRKAKGVLQAGATKIRVVSPAFHPEIPDSVERINDVYHPRYLNGAFLVFAATDSTQVNNSIVAEAQRIGALVCRADADEKLSGDFSTPAVLRDGDLLVTVSTGGNPALAARARDRIAQVIDPRWGRMAEAMQTLRPEILRKVDLARRAEVFRELCTDAALDQLADGMEQLKSWLGKRYPELKD